MRPVPVPRVPVETNSNGPLCPLVQLKVPLPSYAGDLRDGETRTFEDACTATRRGGKVVWTEPPKGLAKAA
jgi:hypothetical protein